MNDRIDFSPLDGALAASRKARLVGSVMAALEVPRDDVPGVWDAVWNMARPAFIAATLLLATGTAIIVRGRSPRWRPGTVAEALGVPRDVERWMTIDPHTAAPSQGAIP